MIETLTEYGQAISQLQDAIRKILAGLDELPLTQVINGYQAAQIAVLRLTGINEINRHQPRYSRTATGTAAAITQMTSGAINMRAHLEGVLTALTTDPNLMNGGAEAYRRVMYGEVKL